MGDGEGSMGGVFEGVGGELEAAQKLTCALCGKNDIAPIKLPLLLRKHNRPGTQEACDGAGREGTVTVDGGGGRKRRERAAPGAPAASRASGGDAAAQADPAPSGAASGAAAEAAADGAAWKKGRNEMEGGE